MGISSTCDMEAYRHAMLPKAIKIIRAITTMIPRRTINAVSVNEVIVLDMLPLEYNMIIHGNTT